MRPAHPSHGRGKQPHALLCLKKELPALDCQGFQPFIGMKPLSNQRRQLLFLQLV